MPRPPLLVLTLAAAFLVPGLASAQISHGGSPPSLDPELAPWLEDTVPRVVLPAVDLAALRAEDQLRDLDKSLPWRFGVDIPVELGLDTAGAWELLPGGDRVWRLQIEAPGAVSLSLALDRFVLPSGGQFFVRSSDGREILGAFTEANNKADGRFATTLVFSDSIVLEYREPARAERPAELSLLRVTHGYRDARSASDVAWNNSGACQNNVACPLAAGWDEPIRSVVKYVMGGGLCTGALINNTAQDGTPYFLTADHCYSNPSYWVFWFNYESSTCGDPSWEPDYDSLSGASYRASNGDSDFVLVELSTSPPDSYGAYYAGWSRSSSPPSSAVGIHHPAGDIKKFSYEGSQISSWGSYWDVGPWDDGTTEGGSSGSPLFDSNQRIVGQLYGGSSACWGGSENNGTDIYGRLDVSWSGSSSSSRLSDWLDPLGTGATVLDGFDPTLPAWANDAGVSILSPADGSVHCGSVLGVEVEITNHGSESLSSATLEYRIDGGAWSTQAWSGSLAQGASTTVVLAELVLSAGAHDIEVELDAAGADQNPGNDAASSEFEVQGEGGVSPPLLEGFEGASFPPSGWMVVNPDSEEAWLRSSAAGGAGASAASAFFDNFEDDHRGEVDFLYAPSVDLRGLDSPVVEFEVAYARYSYDYSDGLAVHVSDDCGGSWTTVYDKSGTSLATASDHEGAFVPTASEWRTESVSLAAWADEPSVQVVFGNLTGYGNNLFVDDIFIGSSEPGGGEEDPGDDDDAADDGAADDDDDDSEVPGGGDEELEGEPGEPMTASVKSGDEWVVEPYCGAGCGAGGPGPRAGGSLCLGALLCLLAGRRRRAASSRPRAA